MYYSIIQKRWFLPQDGDGACFHNGHVEVDPDEVHVSTANLAPEDLHRVLSQLECNISIPSIRAMLLAEHGTNFTYEQQLQGNHHCPPQLQWQ